MPRRSGRQSFLPLAGDDFTSWIFSVTERVREFCKSREIAFRDAAERLRRVAAPNQEQLRQIFERFEGETFASGQAGRRIPLMRRSRGLVKTEWMRTNRPRPTLFAPFASRRRLGDAA